MNEFFQAVRGQPLKIYGICLFGLTLSNADQSLFGYAIPGLIREFEIGLDSVGLILSISFVFAALFSLFAGVVADLYGRRWVYVACLILPAFLVGLHTFVPDVTTLTILRALAFGLTATLVPISTTYVAEVAPDKYRGLLTGLLQAGFALGWFIASLVSVPILALYSWRYIFLPAFVVIPMAIALSFLLPESEKFLAKKNKKQERLKGPANMPAWNDHLTTLKDPVIRRRIVLCTLLFFFHGGAYAGSAFFLPQFLTDTRGYSEQDAVALTGLSYFIGLIGYLSSALIGEFVLTRRNTVAIWIALGTLGFIGFIWFADGRTSDLIWFGLMTIFFYGSAAVIWPLGAELFPTHVRATAAAVSGAGILFGFTLYPYVVSLLVEPLGWQMAFTIVVIPSLALAVVSVLGLENFKSGVALDELAREEKTQTS